MKYLGGILLILLSLVFFLGVAGYGGAWYCFILPIVDVINQIKKPEVDAWIIAWAVFRFFIGFSVALTVGIWGGIITFGFGIACLCGDNKSRR